MDISVHDTVTLKVDPEFRAEVWAMTVGSRKAILKVDDWGLQDIPQARKPIRYTERLMEELVVVTMPSDDKGDIDE